MTATVGTSAVVKDWTNPTAEKHFWKAGPRLVAFLRTSERQPMTQPAQQDDKRCCILRFK
jgi:hypothetical protein